MIDTVLAKVFGTKHDREVKSIRPLIDAICALEPAIQALSDADLAAKTVEFRQKLANAAPLDDILVEAFAVVREASWRTVHMRHFDEQLIGGVVLHRGKIAEMKTGEGKTLVATAPVYLNALEGKGVHVVTVNDYLARRDSEWMGRIYKFLGLTVGLIVHGLDDEERKAAYGCDITYGTNNEYGFDYLRDNMKFRLDDCVQRAHHYAIVDEVDSILVDEARTPLIISGPSEESTDKYYKVNGIIPRLNRGEVIEGREPGEKYYTGDYTVDEKHRSVALTEEGVAKVERLLNIPNLYDPEYIELNHHVQQGLRAHVLYERDRDYLVKDGEVVIVDEFTGRLMPGRRWSDGLHQAIEAKEGVKIERENQTLATITFQNYFRMYKKLAGMTGTADTEAAEFQKIYNLDVVVVPTHRKMIRNDQNDIVYRTQDEKWRNVAKEIETMTATGRPVLVGTVSVEKSEKLASILKRMGVRHEILNAKNHEREASLVAQAGRKGTVTVSTNMAGRGTDILLGGNPEFLAQEDVLKLKWVESLPKGTSPVVADREFYYFQRGDAAYRVPVAKWNEVYDRHKGVCDADHEEVVSLGGLHIVGTERHESRRIDNQLRGRAGRQGDPGSSRFYLSLEDDLMRIFGGDRVKNLMSRLGMKEDEPIESGMITSRIEAAQKAVETQNFSSRKHVLEYDDVMNKQRQSIYGMRRELLEGQDIKDRIFELVEDIIGSLVDIRCPENKHFSEYEIAGLQTDLLTRFGVKFGVEELSGLSRVELEEMVMARLRQRYDEKEELVGAEVMRDTERMIMLSVIDQQWKDHLLSMDHLKEWINMKAYAQKDPLVEYKKEAYELFQGMKERLEDETVRFLFFLQPVQEDRPRFLGGNGDLDQELPELESEHSENGANQQDRKKAQDSMINLTQKIERQKEREMDMLQFTGGEATAPSGPVVKSDKVGRNDPCPCGSGKKYKKCHGALKAFSAALLAMPILLAQGVLPEKWGPHTRTGAGAPLTPADPALFAEYGGEAAESAAYNGPAGKFRTSAWRFKDSTGAFAWYQSIRPENAVPLSGSQGLAVVTPGTQILTDQNYVLQFEGWRPTKKELESLNSQLPNKRSAGGLPLLPGYLPEKNRVRNSERYLVGLSGLTKFLPGFPATLAGFESGGEGQAARFRAGDGSVRDVVIFNYPTPHIARERLAEFEKQSDWVVHRSGNLVAVAPGAKGVPGIESLVKGVEYKFDFTWNQATKLPPMPDVGGMLSAIVDLTGVLLVVCVLGGTLCAFLVSYLRRRDVRLQGTNATMVSLQIDKH